MNSSAPIRHSISLLIVSVLMVVLVACGGGGGGGGNSSTQTTQSQSQTTSNPTPAISSISPTSTTAGSGSTQVTITGSGFIAGSSAQWNGSARPTTYVSSTVLEVTIAAADLASAETAQIAVMNPAPGGGTSGNAAFTINNPTPTISSANPASVIAASGSLTVTITGTGFVAQSVVQWNGSARTTTYVSATQLQASLTAADVAGAGTAQISVVNPAPGGGATSNLGFTINNPVPSISATNPSAVYAGNGSTVVTVTGTGFVAQSVVQWNGSSRATTYVSGTQLQATLTAADLASSSTGTITVVNAAPGGGASSGASVPVTYATPGIQMLAPSNAVINSADTVVNITGSGFAPASVVNWNGAPLPTVFASSALLRATVPAADLTSTGSFQITVVNPIPGGGTAQAQFSVTTYPPPVITSISPTSVYVGSATQNVFVYGNSLEAVSVVQVNGTAVPTTVNYCWTPGNPTICSLSASIDASNFTVAGSLAITVFTPPPAGGTSGPLPFSVVAPPPPVLSTISPSTTAIGSDDFTLNLYGSNFTTTSSVLWNGSPRPTQYVNSSRLTATISKMDVATFGTSQVSVSTPAPGGGTSTSLPFSTYLSLPANDLVYSSATQLLYASVPSSGGPTLGNSIVPIDPNTGVLGTPIWVGSEPNRMALSSDGLTIWVGIDGAASVRKANLSTGTASTQFYLGGGNGVYSNPYTAKGLAVMGGSPDTVAVMNGAGLVSVYDSGVLRGNPPGPSYPYSGNPGGLVFDNSGSYLYSASYGYTVMHVDSTGIASSTLLNSSATGTDLVYTSGIAYLNSGAILDAASGNKLGTFSIAANQAANGPIAVDSVVGRAFMLVNPSYGFSYQINAYDISNYTLQGSIPITLASTTYPTAPTRLVRWGQDGLAATGGGQVYILRSTLVRDLSTNLADIAVSVLAPNSVATGSDITYNITVTDHGPSTANPVTLFDFLPSGTTFKTASASQGSCAGGYVVRCNLGSIPNQGTATVQITATALAAGTLTNVANVSAAQGDSNTANNSISTDVTASGTAYGAAPALYSISPAIAVAGSSTFPLTVNGGNFNAASTVQWNGVGLPTTYVTSSQLIAQVDSSNVAGLGWAWVTVNTPTPGGGTTSSVPFTTYQVVTVTTNDILFDPFTRKIYASVPGTATQVTPANSIVAIDPYSGSLDTPVFIGSEPHQLAETDDGKYLYVGLNGQNAITRLDLTTMTKASAAYPLNAPACRQMNNSCNARDLAVMPGTENTLAVDTGSWTGLGILDIDSTGTTGTMRSTITGPYTGSSIVFPDASTLYSFDVDTSFASFNRWTVTSTGLTKIDVSTLNGMGAYQSNAFHLVDGLVYGLNGGVADPTTTPPSMRGTSAVSNSVPNNTFEVSSFAVDPDSSRAFYIGSTTAGYANPYLEVFDLSRYELLNLIAFPGNSVTGTNMLRWGSDGLAWQVGPWPSYMGAPTQILLLRGPLVQPYLSVVNSKPGVSSVSPSSTAAGSGNVMLTVTGTGFVPGATVWWNGAERSTTYVDSTHVQVAIPAADVTSSGTATLTAKNPGTGASSSSVTFTIN